MDGCSGPTVPDLPVASLQLRPDLAAWRLEYGDGYNNFNTCYYQASSSSGSPVVNIDGYAVALQAGGRHGASTDHFLSLDRPLHALRCLQGASLLPEATFSANSYSDPSISAAVLGSGDCGSS